MVLRILTAGRKVAQVLYQVRETRLVEKKALV